MIYLRSHRRSFSAGVCQHSVWVPASILSSLPASEGMARIDANDEEPLVAPIPQRPW